jgi:hypothetical protein
MAIKKRLGEMLVDAGIIDDSQLHAALRHQRQWGGRLGGILVELKLASEGAIVDALALKFGFEIARLDRIEPYAFEQARALVPHEYAVRNRVFPMSADTGLLVVAMSDPTNLALTDELAFKTGRRVKVCIAGDNAISAAIRAHFGEDASGQREAIALEPDDDSAMEAVYDPIGATSSEQMSHFFEQPAAPQAAPPPAKAPAARPAAAQVAQARAPAAPAAPARAATPAAAPAKSAVVRPTASELEAAAARARSRSPSVLQLEDQPTGSIPLDELQPVEEELQPIPLETEAEAEAPREAEPFAPGQEAYAAGEEAYGAGPEAPAEGAETWVEGAGEQATDAGGYAVAGAEGAEGAYPQRELTEEEVEVLAALDRLAHGDEATPTVVRPAQLVAALIRLMLRKQWITEHELLDEILRG